MKLLLRKEMVTIGKERALLSYYHWSDETKYLQDLKRIYSGWKELSRLTSDLGGRKINVPAVLSEGLYAFLFQAVRKKSWGGKHGSFDCFHRDTKLRIQVKACSVTPDCTSFGPTSTWDNLVFMNFTNDNGDFTVHHIPQLIEDISVNKTQTMKDQAKEKRRPRFSLHKEFVKTGIARLMFEGNIHSLTPTSKLKFEFNPVAQPKVEEGARVNTEAKTDRNYVVPTQEDSSSDSDSSDSNDSSSSESDSESSDEESESDSESDSDSLPDISSLEISVP